MKCVLIKNGVVVNVIEPHDPADTDYAAYLAANFDAYPLVDDSAYVGPGFTYDGTNFIAPPVTDNQGE